jgi:hypothetical protein
MHGASKHAQRVKAERASAKDPHLKDNRRYRVWRIVFPRATQARCRRAVTVAGNELVMGGV